MEKNETGFGRFVFSKIVENSDYPSRHIRAMFHPDKWQNLLVRYMKTGRNTKKLEAIFNALRDAGLPEKTSSTKAAPRS